MSDDLFKGERGERGDHGQPGHAGVRGPQGAPGKAAEDHWYSLTDRRLLVIFVVFVLGAGLLLQGITSQQRDLSAAQEAIKVNAYKIELANFARCKDGVAILKKFNNTQRDLAALELSEPEPGSLRAQRAQIYLDSVIDIPSCTYLKPEKSEAPR